MDRDKQGVRSVVLNEGQMSTWMEKKQMSAVANEKPKSFSLSTISCLSRPVCPRVLPQFQQPCPNSLFLSNHSEHNVRMRPGNLCPNGPILYLNSSCAREHAS